MIEPGSERALIASFGGGKYRFFLPMKGIVEVERLCGKPLGVIYDEMSASMGLEKATDNPVYLIGGTARISDAYHVIRKAAEMGGQAELAGEVVKVSAIDATNLVDQHVADADYDEFMPVAWAILRNTMSGATLKKKAEAERLARSKPSAADTSSPPAVS